MTTPSLSDLNQGNRLVSALLRPLGAMLLLLVSYFLLPIGHESDWNHVGCATGGVLLFLFCVWEVRHFLRSKDRPVETSIEMIAAVMCFYVVAFSATYYLLSEYTVGAFNERLTRIDALYFCLAVSTTTGFGDIAAESQVARVAVSVQMAATVVLIGLGIRFVNILVQDRVTGKQQIKEYRTMEADEADDAERD